MQFYDCVTVPSQRRVQHVFSWMDGRPAASEFVAGPSCTITDITTHVAVEFTKWARLSIPDTCPNLLRWVVAVSARPSAKG